MSDVDENLANKDVPPWLQPVSDAEESKVGQVVSKRTMIAASVAVALVVFFIGALVLLYESAPPPPRVVTAEMSDIRKKPEEPGGMNVSHQDKEIFEAADGSAPVSRVELSPRTEQPLGEIPNLEAVKPEGITADAAASQDKIGQIAAAVMKDEPAANKTAPQPETVAPKPEKAQSTSSTPTSQSSASTTEPVAIAGQFSVQLGAFSTEKSAATAWRAIRAKFLPQLGELQPIYVPVEAGNRTLYRLRAGPVASRDEADALCIALRAQEQGCFVVTP